MHFEDPCSGGIEALWQDLLELKQRTAPQVLNISTMTSGLAQSPCGKNLGMSASAHQQDQDPAQ